MKTVISISDARKQLPGIIKSFKNSPDAVYQITVHDEVVAEIKKPAMVRPGEAATRLLAIRRKLKTKKKQYRSPISENVKDYLYVAEDGL
ncbi:MAG: hypothetical protein EPN25_07200 [Nitrospirae bacterium]|nr:MAG: hypothetical protein EPN25_07200 [Nitrospirota bacterium]